MGGNANKVAAHRSSYLNVLVTVKFLGSRVENPVSARQKIRGYFPLHECTFCTTNFRVGSIMAESEPLGPAAPPFHGSPSRKVDVDLSF